MTLLLLRAGRLAVDLAPAAGGAIARFTSDGGDVLRPMTAEAVASGRGNDAAAFPLVPYSNRIANGRLEFAGREIGLAPNWPGQHHPMHGDGWAVAWQVEQAEPQQAEIVYLHERSRDGGWPFRYRARQVYRLNEEQLSVRLEIENLEGQHVPAGIGLHPFFVRDADTRLTCRTKAAWRADAEVLPVERIEVPRAWDFSAGRRIDDVVLDNCFDGWDGHATITWPSRGLSLDLMADGTLAHLVIFTPPARAFFCVEPVSHANGQVGRSVLEAGATLAGTVVFRLTQLVSKQ